MYTIECDGTVIYNDAIAAFNPLVQVFNPKLDMSDNAAGSLEMTFSSDATGYSLCKKFTSTIVVKRDNKWLWEGRILTESENFLKQKVFKCEGALSFLNDTILPKKTYNVNSMGNLLSQLLSVHNSKVSNSRKIYLGAVTVNPQTLQNTYETNYESVLGWISQNILDVFGGHLRIRRDGNQLKLDYYADYPDTSDQTITFGTNLLDFSKNYDLTDIVTVVIPRGKQLSTDEETGTEYLTVASVNNNSIYVVNTEALNLYGRVEKTIDFSEIEDPRVLLESAKSYLSTYQYNNMILEIKAVDLHCLNVNIDSFDFLDQVRCVSPPHGLDAYFPVTQISIPLNQPDQTTYTMGSSSSYTLTNGLSARNSEIKTKFDELPTRESVLVEAKRNASEILTRKTTGYVNIVDQGDHSEALIISNTPNWKYANKYWKFDMNGLGYWQNGKLGGIAITMDGRIVADFITTGTMSADRIRAGIIKDVYNNNVINLETGQVYLQANKTTVKTTDGRTYSIASMKDINSLNEDITSINRKQMIIETDIDGIHTSVSSLEANYGYSSTPSNEPNKIVTCKDFILKKGSVIVVKFSYASYYNSSSSYYIRLNVNDTGPKYIMLNGTYILTNKTHWKSGETVNFVYDGSRYVISDGATESHIRQLADSISLSVTGSLGNTAKIALYADGDKYEKEIKLSNVKEAFANDASTIYMRAGKMYFRYGCLMDFSGGTFVLDATNCKIDSSGNITATNANMYGGFRAGYTNGRRIELDSAQLRGYNYDNQLVGYIEPGTSSTWVDSGRVDKSLQIKTNGVLRISTPYITVANSSDTSVTAISGWTGHLSLTINMNSDMTSCQSINAEFINGIFVGWD